jgi:hypothetical protein
MRKIIIIVMLIGLVLETSCNKNEVTDTDNVSEFTKEQKVTITGYTSDAMEPFITKNGNFLFFNNHQGANGKELYYAERINDTTFIFKGEIQGVNSAAVNGNPTMDEYNNLYFISTRNIDTSIKTIYSGIFNNGILTGLHEISGTINITTPYWINMGVEVSKNGNTLFTSNAKFNVGENFPHKGNIRFAVKNGNEFNIPDNETEILKNINTETAIEYAGELSANELELFYLQVVLSNPPIFKLYYAKREQIDEKFGKPISITDPFKDNLNAFVEGPSLSNDGKRLYYHKLENDVFSIFMLSRE